MKIALNKPLVAERLYLFGLVLLAASLPLSKFMISVSEFVLVAGWLMNSRLVERIRQFFRTPSAWMISAIYVLFVIGLLYSLDNMEHGLKELRIKLPIMILPFIIATAPALSRRQWNYVIGFFIASVLAGTGISTHILATTDILDTRNISPYISHIRFGLMLSLAFFACIYFARNTMLWYLRLLMIILPAWILVFLVLLESVTGLGITITLGILMLIYLVIRKGKKWVRLVSFISLVAIVVFAVFFARNIIKEELVAPEVDFSELEETTAQGNPYYHDTTSTWHENGHYIYLYICEPEMKETWNKRSDIPYSGLDKKDQKLKYTLIRFLNSKGFRKDARGVNKLTKDEIQAIENGIANINYIQRSSLRARLSQIIYEYKNYRLQGDPSGHSVFQRLEFWKAALGIIQEKPFIGVGTGNINQSFDKEYKEMQTQLDKEYRLRSHNQYLRIGATLGLLGLGLFLLFLFYPVLVARAWEEALFVAFLYIALMSMITEDTLETQVGATFFAFFYSFLLWSRRNIFTKRR